MPKIYDGFIFYNELELLEIRLNELKDVVDYHIVVEAYSTFSGNPKPFVFDENKELFKDFLHKIFYVQIQKFNSDMCWHREFEQRNAIAVGLQNADKQDVIMVGDIDELPAPAAIKEAVKELSKTNQTQCLETQLYFYGLNYKCSNNPIWPAPSLCYVKDLVSPQVLRTNQGDKYNRIKKGGWHFSYLGGLDKIKSKIESYSHTDMNTDEIKDDNRLLRLINEGKSIIPGCTRLFEKIEINYDNSPRYLVDNIDKFKHLIL